MTAKTLNYAAPEDGRVRQYREGGAHVVELPYDGPWPRAVLIVRGLYGQAAGADLLAIVLWPLIAVVDAAFFIAYRVLPKPPRPPLVRVVISSEIVRVEVLDRDWGYIKTEKWPRAKVAELRRNAYRDALFVRVIGVVQKNVADALPPGDLPAVRCGPRAGDGRHDTARSLNLRSQI